MSYRTDSDKMYNLESVKVMPEKMPFGVDTCIADGEVWLEVTLEAAADNSITLFQAWMGPHRTPSHAFTQDNRRRALRSICRSAP